MTETPKAPETPSIADAPAGRVRPAMPERGEGEAPADTLRELHRFHLAPPSPPQAGAGPGILPALLHSRREEPLGGGYPLFLGPSEAGEPAACVTLPDLLLRATPEGEEAGALRERLDDLAGRLRRAVASRRLPRDARPLIQEAGEALAEEAGEAAEGLKAGLDLLLAAVPAGGRFVPFSEQAPLHLVQQAASSRLLPARAAFREEAQSLAAQAEALLQADRLKSPERRQAGAVEGSMGGLGSRFVDPAALAGLLDPRSGGTALPALRRERLEAALEAVTGYLATDPEPQLVLVHDGLHGIPGCEALESDGPGGWRIEMAEDPCAAAAEIFDREADAVTRVLRAARRIRLEAEGRYDPERQDPWLERLDWQAFTRRDLLLLPPVVALVAADRVAGRGMVSLSSLLLSGRPVQVLVPVEPAGNPGAKEAAEPLAGFRFEPAYLGLAHREAFVQQTSVAVPAHMMRGFDRALSATHAGLHVISSGARAGGAEAPLGAETQAAAALEGRAHPIFHYDPEAGPSWAERLDFAHNPQTEIDWPIHELQAEREGGGEESLSLPFTFADFALLEPAYVHHFQPIPAGVPEEELVPVAEYSNRPPDDDTAGLPYVWGVDPSSRLVRLAVSRPLALACRDRLSFWRTLQELAGVRSEYVRRAEARSRQEAEAQLQEQRERLEAQHAEELEQVRRDAAHDVVDRLTAALLEVPVDAFAAPTPLAGLAGSSVDDVAAALLKLVDPSTLDEEDGGAEGNKVAEVASELLRLAGDEP